MWIIPDQMKRLLKKNIMYDKLVINDIEMYEYNAISIDKSVFNFVERVDIN